MWSLAANHTGLHFSFSDLVPASLESLTRSLVVDRMRALSKAGHQMALSIPLSEDLPE